MTNEEIVAHQAKERAFYETDLGKAFYKYESALIRYWQNDQNERMSDRRLRELSDASDTARKEFRQKLDELMSPK